MGRQAVCGSYSTASLCKVKKSQVILTKINKITFTAFGLNQAAQSMVSHSVIMRCLVFNFGDFIRV